jgi:hypothetical protein
MWHVKLQKQYRAFLHRGKSQKSTEFTFGGHNQAEMTPVFELLLQHNVRKLSRVDSRVKM